MTSIDFHPGAAGDFMKTFHIQTLGCKVNHYEGEQIAAVLRSHGLTLAANPADADVRVVNSCSVTMQAAAQSRQATRRVTRLPVLEPLPAGDCVATRSGAMPVQVTQSAQAHADGAARPRVVVTGCWATSHPVEASQIAGVDAVLTHQHDVPKELAQLLQRWRDAVTTLPSSTPRALTSVTVAVANSTQVANIVAGSDGDLSTDDLGDNRTRRIQSIRYEAVNDKVGNMAARSMQDMSASPPAEFIAPPSDPTPSAQPTQLPLLAVRQADRQRAYLKIQDGCDAHCTYCIIPSLRPTLSSKSIDATVAEARALVASGHREIVLTGIFLGAYGQPTALRRRQSPSAANQLGELISALGERAPGLGRLRLSSLEPGDLTEALIACLRAHPIVVPHFHLPLQSGSDTLLRRMNRQYDRAAYLAMIDRVRGAFDRPAITTDIVVGFPGETDAEFERTVEVARAAGFIHIHAFPFSPRPGTAAARWTEQFVRGPVVNERIARLRRISEEQSLAYRSTFVGQTVEVIVERDESGPTSAVPRLRHGRCERYFSVCLDQPTLNPGQAVKARVASVTQETTFGIVVD